MNIYEKISKIFYLLGRYESNRERVFPAITFHKVSNQLKVTISHSINESNRVVIHTVDNEDITLGNSSSQIFLQILEQGTCERLLDYQLQYGLIENVEESELLEVSGIGISKAENLIKSGIRTIDDLIESHPIIGEHIGSSSVTFTDQMNAGLILIKNTSGDRWEYNRAKKLADFVISSIKRNNEFSKLNIIPVGSLRRHKSTIGDLDLIIEIEEFTEDYISDLHKFVQSLYDIVAVHGDTKISGVINNFQVDIRFIESKFMGAHVLHATGSREFNIYMRKEALKQGFSLNEYGLTKLSNNQIIYFNSEEEIFDKLNIKYVNPELR